MRSDKKEFPDNFDEYSRFIVSMCNYCQPNYGGMGGIVGYLYQSAKDAIKWHKAKPKEYITLIMAIGRLVYLSEEDFSKTMNHYTADTISDEEVRQFYENDRKEKAKKAKEKLNGRNSN